MNILVVTGSPRAGANTEIMANTFAAAAKRAGHEVKVMSTSGKTINPCINCEHCAVGGECIHNDDMLPIYEAMEKADMMVFASPIYWFNVSAQMKLVIDRIYAKYRQRMRIRRAAILLNAYASGTFDGSLAAFRDMCRYLGWQNDGNVCIGGMLGRHDIEHSRHLHEVEEFAMSL